MELVWEIISMSLCMLVVGYGLHYFAFKTGIADEHDKVKTDTLKKRAKDNKKNYKTGNGFLDKWLDFGGGYYGGIALIKLILIELGQIEEFISNWQGLDNFINDIGVGMLISFFVEQITNFVAAIIWPTDYLSRFSIEKVAIFVGITYLAYEFSRKLARHKVNRLSPSGYQ